MLAPSASDYPGESHSESSCAERSPGSCHVHKSLPNSYSAIQWLKNGFHRHLSFLSFRRFSPSIPSHHKKTSKAVRFDESNLEKVQPFSKTDSPLAIQALNAKSQCLTTSDIRSMKFIEFPPFSYTRLYRSVRLEWVWLSPAPGRLLAFIAVANFPGHKYVALRFTFDGWKTIYEARGRCTDQSPAQCTIAENKCFVVSIDLAKLVPSRPTSMCCYARYHIRGYEYWDNNDGSGFCVKLR